MTDDELNEWLQVRKDAEQAAGYRMFMKIPDRWFDDQHFRCGNGHVSRMILKSETRGDLCLAGGCGRNVRMTFPEDVEETS